MIKSILVDQRNFDALASQIKEAVRSSSFIGLDCETHDDNRHEGLNAFCNYNPVTRKKAGNTKLVFDMKRTTMTGFSIYPEDHEFAYYINLNHADVENRISWEQAKSLLDAKSGDSHWVAHNANYELSTFKNCYDYPLPDYICTMQMAVSAFGPDEYDRRDFVAAGQGGIKVLVAPLIRASLTYEPEKYNDMDSNLSELVYKIIGKTTTSAFSYNGFVKDISYGYGLKKLVKKFFGIDMPTFNDTLSGKAHMGQLTGEDTFSYGADDAYWAVRLFRQLMTYMAENCPATISTFFNQENPMVAVYSNIWTHGMNVNHDNIKSRRILERETMAAVLRSMKASVKALLPFEVEPSKNLAKEKWYTKNYSKYRAAITLWANSPDHTDSLEQCRQVRGPVSNVWCSEQGFPEPTGVNFSHYMPMRVLMYDLCVQKPIVVLGKVQSDGESRGKLRDRMSGSAQAIIDGLNEIAGVEQRMKSYLTPYSQLTDPDTDRMYPVVTSMLATRRMASETPNTMALTKRGEATYVRGFFESDHEDHVLISTDWSSVELVEIGEFSADPEFIKAYGQIPHQDLHAGAAADVLAIDVIGLNENIFNSLKTFEKREDFEETYKGQMTNTNRLFTNLKGEELEIGKCWKFWRTEVGKGANFGYWYSGFLGQLGETMGWDINKTAAASDRYKSRFHVAEQWRLNLIAEGRSRGFITLPDNHRRVRWEATDMWNQMFCDKFVIPNSGDELARKYNGVIRFMAGKIQKRAFNQLVNAMIQGSCATLAKRSILRIIKACQDAGYTEREVRFWVPVHDELVFSVKRELVVPVMHMIRRIMCDHPDMFKHCKLDASPSIGLTFEPWNAKKAPTGQIEVFEAPDLPFISRKNVGGRMSDDEVRGTVEYLFNQRRIERIAA